MFGRRTPELKVAKVILLGADNVGKTTLIVRWNSGHFERNTYTTIGMFGTAFKKNVFRYFVV